MITIIEDVYRMVNLDKLELGILFLSVIDVLLPYFLQLLFHILLLNILQLILDFMTGLGEPGLWM